MMPQSQAMKTILPGLSLFAITLFVFGVVGCHRQAAGVSEQPKTLSSGIIDLRAALTTASPAVQSNLYNGVAYDIRYGNYTKAAADLQLIAADASLNDKQKQVVNEVSNLLNQAIVDQRNGTPPAR